MKTEKKTNETTTCLTTTITTTPVVKEEPDSGDGVKIKEESTATTNNINTNNCNNDNIARGGEETTECQRESNQIDPNHSDRNTMSQDNQNGSNNNCQSIIKQENNEQNHPGDDLPSDCAAGVGLSSDGIQPLVSNVLGKQMGTGTGGGEAQYMQQQSQIFVFSTMLANKGADAVLQGQFPSIIAYHCAQPGTKKYLEKHPSKVNQFRQNPAQWLNNLAMMKQKGQGGQGGPNSGFPTEQPPDLPALEPNAPPFWNEQSNIRNLNGSSSMGNPESSLDDTNIDVPCLVPNSPNNSGNSQPPTSTAMGHSPSLLGTPSSPGAGGLQPSLQGVKVPDENLTPQQRLHREEQLATIRKMQMILFPERKEEGTGPGTIDPAQGAPQTPGQGAPNVSGPPSGGPSAVEWHKLQHHFFDGKNKVGVGSPNAVALRGGGVGATPRGQGPPPPYHQTTRSASVPIAIQSPNPSSPNNPTSNLSLPSPRASSALNSPADCNRQFQIGNQRPGHLPGQSPTSQDSPNPGANTTTANQGPRLNHSNPGTPVSHSHITALSPNGIPPQKDPLDFPTNQPTNMDGMFCRTLQSLAQQKQQHGSAVNASGVKEANLMPVPSPQQIQYLNTFEGQELTIQKQPNTSLKDSSSLPTSTNNASNEVQNRMLPGNMESNNQFPARSEGASPSMDSVNRGFVGPLHSPHTPHTPGSVAPHTPVDPMKAGNNKTNNNTTTTSAQNSPAPHNTNLTDSMGPPRTVPASPNTKVDTSPPSSKEQQQQQQQQQQLVVANANNSGNNGPVLGPGFPCSRPSVNVNQPADNVPLNPNNIGGRLGGLGGMNSNHFDPITSLAQMSQQLTNTAASNALGGGPEGPMHSGNPGMMPFNPHVGMQHMMQMGEMNGCHMGPGQGNEPGDVGGLCMGLGGPPSSYSPTPHTGSPGVNNKMGNPMMSHPMMHPGPYPNDGHGPPRLMGHGPGPSPYNGANVQVKPSAPNTIQYLPARPNVGHAPRGPPSLDFLQRFTNPLSNMESKMQSPSVNLQYFPNGCVPNNMGPHSGMSNVMGGIPGMGGGPPPRMDTGQPMNNSINVHPSMRPVGNMRPQPNIMRMQHMVGGGVFPGGMMDPDKVFPQEMVSQVPNQQNPGMYVPGSKGSPMGLGPPDASQPLPPSMGGASSNFKSSPFVGGGPNMSDPNYAQQFHNFQQQLYATGTRGSGPPHPNLHPPPNSHSHQQFFMPK